MPYAINRKTIKVQTDTHHQNSLSGEDLMQKITEIDLL